MADLTITAANVAPSTGYTPGDGTAGATITAGQPLYIDSSDSNKLKLADANSSLATATCVGIALHAASSGQPIRYIKGGQVNLGATLTVGETYCVSNTAGGICPIADLTSGSYPGHLGIAISASILQMQIHLGGVAKA